ncbi:hypothetical protein RFI_02531 [Reticulomyxa filosa]|uniref:Uncharacterized protein n=1 Tax=Reticulomyxa filosa TaxID=46433 RepID=X6P7R5_RETFI|nr:hypothetical protein RFI_02531 [Reticulomyxa filosa]|eukprot:ETO34565.1 hypothetical protein RFI_02531 [Reticulomyxa filosa]
MGIVLHDGDVDDIAEPSGINRPPQKMEKSPLHSPISNNNVHTDTPEMKPNTTDWSITPLPGHISNENSQVIKPTTSSFKPLPLKTVKFSIDEYVLDQNTNEIMDEDVEEEENENDESLDRDKNVVGAIHLQIELNVASNGGSPSILSNAPEIRNENDAVPSPHKSKKLEYLRVPNTLQINRLGAEDKKSSTSVSKHLTIEISPPVASQTSEKKEELTNQKIAKEILKINVEKSKHKENDKDKEKEVSNDNDDAHFVFVGNGTPEVIDISTPQHNYGNISEWHLRRQNSVSKSKSKTKSTSGSDKKKKQYLSLENQKLQVSNSIKSRTISVFLMGKHMSVRPSQKAMGNHLISQKYEKEDLPLPLVLSIVDALEQSLCDVYENLADPFSRFQKTQVSLIFILYVYFWNITMYNTTYNSNLSSGLMWLNYN